MDQNFAARRHKVKLIVNPNADLGRAWIAARDLRPIVEEYGGANWAGTVYPTHASELAAQAGAAGYELVIAAGGDGTVHEVINGLMQVPPESRPRLGVIPLGSGNDFAYGIGMAKDPLPALKQIFEGRPKRVDVGVLHDSLGRTEYWDNTLGIGFDTTVTIRSRKFRMFRGFLVYLLAVVQTILLNHEAIRMNVQTDRESWEREMLLLALCNGGREGGGFRVHPGAKMDDGVLNYAGIERVSRPMMFRLLPEVMRGTHAGFRSVHMGDFCRMQIEANRPLYIHTDGEIFSSWGVDVRSLEVKILPGELEVVA
jgi:YegS/Rv2252/BmrU family lipid kinase